jgi:hypothetical protein
MGLIDSIISAESGGNPNAVNPRSSATGAGQFISATWIDTIKKARPDLAQGKSDEELLALRTDPAISREMTEAYAAQNGAILSKAGHPVTPGTTYLAHFAGPQGAVSVLNADPSAPVASVMGQAAVKANPFLQGMTVGDLRSWADRKMGGAQPAPQATPAPAITLSQPSAPLSLAQAPPMFAAPQQAAPQQAGFEMPQPMQAPPIFAPPRKQIDLSKLRAAFQAPNFYRG